jgi:hypothetical protein
MMVNGTVYLYKKDTYDHVDTENKKVIIGVTTPLGHLPGSSLSAFFGSAARHPSPKFEALHVSWRRGVRVGTRQLGCRR